MWFSCVMCGEDMHNENSLRFRIIWSSDQLPRNMGLVAVNVVWCAHPLGIINATQPFTSELNQHASIERAIRVVKQKGPSAGPIMPNL